MDSRLTSREDVTLLVAAQSHRNWVDRIAGHLDHPQDEAPNTLDSVHCRFGRWYQGSGAARYGEFREFQAIAPLHETVHIIATGLVALARDGQLEAARDRLPIFTPDVTSCWHRSRRSFRNWARQVTRRESRFSPIEIESRFPYVIIYLAVRREGAVSSARS